MSTLSVTTITTANASTNQTLTTGNSAAGKIVVPASGGLVLASNATTNAVTISSNSYIGIGTSSPTGILDVQGGNTYFKVGSATYDSATIGPRPAGDGTSSFTLQANSSAGNKFDSTSSGLSIYANNSATFHSTFTANGNLGVGTTSPATKLQIGTGATNETITVRGLIADATFGNDSTGVLIGTVNNAAVRFTTNAAERMRITPTGNVGIGTSSPSEKLDVAGAVRSSGSTNPYFVLSDGTNNGYMQLASNVFNFYTAQAIPMTFSTSGSEKMRIDSSGNLLFNSGYGSVTTAYGCRAWVNFDGTTATPSTIRGSGNVTSVTKNGTGNYTINFTNAMPDANYAITAAMSAASGANMYPPYFGREVSSTSAPTTTSFMIWTKNSANSLNDPPYLSFAIFR